MAKYFGVIGYGVTEETSPDVYTETITEREYYGDISHAARRWTSGQNLNDNMELDHALSIVADPFALQHFSTIRYVMIQGQKWKVKSAEVQYPRLVLTIGGVYNENEA